MVNRWLLMIISGYYWLLGKKTDTDEGQVFQHVPTGESNTSGWPKLEAPVTVCTGSPGHPLSQLRMKQVEQLFGSHGATEQADGDACFMIPWKLKVTIFSR